MSFGIEIVRIPDQGTRKNLENDTLPKPERGRGQEHGDKALHVEGCIKHGSASSVQYDKS